MGEDNERVPLKLPIYEATSTLSFMDSPEHPSGTATPPLQPPASVPFKWEETPGKPRPYSDIIVTRPEPAPKSLELPPMMSKTPSPTSVLDGPYNVGRPKFSSFRFFLDGHDSLFHSPIITPAAADDDDMEYGGLFGVSKKKKKSSRGFFGKVKGGIKELNGGISGFSPFSTTSCESDDHQSLSSSNGGRKMRRNGSFSSVPQHKSSSPLSWATIYSGFKQVIQWKSSRKSNKQG